MNLHLKALDTLFFRDGKPFQAGDDNSGSGIFPPYPNTIYGAVTTWLAKNNPELQTQLFDKPEAVWELKALYYKVFGRTDGKQFYFPMPLDLVSPKKQTEEEDLSLECLDLADEQAFTDQKKSQEEDLSLECLDLVKTQAHSNSYQLDYQLSKEDKEVESPEALIDFESLKTYLNSSHTASKTYSGLSLTSLVGAEPKLGIARSKTSGTVSEGMLYSIGLKRLKGLSFCLELDLKAHQASMQAKLPFMKLGGEGKAVEVKLAESADCAKLERLRRLRLNSDAEHGKTRFKIYLASPAIFLNQGWKPSLNIKAKLITAAVGKPLAIGGFDLKNRQPKPMYKGVPAGSVYYYETDLSAEEVQTYFASKSSLSECYAEQGFGLFFIGNV